MNNFINKTFWKDFALFPCKHNSKIPATFRGFKDAQFNFDYQMFIEQGYNIALACSTSGVIVIDLDYHDSTSKAFEDLEALEDKLGKLPKTLTQSTASCQGRHLIFSSKGIINPIGKLSKNIDVKYNGYIMIAPSCINGNYYKIIGGINQYGEKIIAELPTKWKNYLNSNHTKSKLITKHKVMTKQVYSNIDQEKLFKQCHFLKYCKDNAENLEEPMWHSMITVLAQIENSDELIHDLSEPYYQYSYNETQNKIDYARKFGHPQSCTYISSNYPNACANCSVVLARKENNND